MNRIKLFAKKYFQNFIYFYDYLHYRVFVRMLFSISVGLLDGFGLAMFLPLLQMIDGSSAVEGEGLGSLKFIIDGFSAVGIELNLFNVLTLLAFFFIFKGLAVYASRIYEVKVRQYFLKKIRITLTNNLSKLSYKHFVLSDVGRIQNTMTGEISKISQAYFNYFDTIQHLILVLVYMAFAFSVDAQFALLISVGGFLTNYLFKRIFTSMEQASAKLTKRSHVFQGLVIQLVAFFKYLKATGSIKKLNIIVLKTIHDIEDNNTQIGKLHAFVNASREPLLIIVVCLVIFLQVNVLGGSLASILVSLLFFYRALSSLIYMQTSYNTFLSVSGTMENMTSFDKELRQNMESEGSIMIEHFRKQIVLDNVSFGYFDKHVLKSISLIILKNETIAFVGESGSGKTTLVNLVATLIPVSEGKLYIDGISSSDTNLDSYRNRIGYITQEPVIFNDTLYNNITLWDKPTAENRTKFEQVLKQAALTEMVNELPQKEKTSLGNNGINLSGGQKQRISIARELYKDIDILILDEATSALDSETEHNIQANIDQLKGKLTILIVAHRLSTIKNADRIVIMEKGHIIDENTFRNLLDTSSKFRKMVELQKFA